MTYEQKQLQLQLSVEKWLRVFKVNQPIEPHQLSKYLAEKIQEMTAGPIRDAYVRGRIDELKYINDDNMGKQPRVLFPEAQAIIHSKDHGWET